jgi:hypothetical protein
LFSLVDAALSFTVSALFLTSLSLRLPLFFSCVALSFVASALSLLF